MCPIRLLVRAAATIFTILIASPTPLLADGASTIASTQAEPSQRTVSTSITEEHPVDWFLILTGTLVARDEIAVGTAQQDQRIASVEVEVGDQIKAGQVLVRLETAMLENKLNESEGRVARTKAALAQQEETLAQAQLALERAGQLKVSGNISRQTHEDRKSSVALAEQGVEVHHAEFVEAKAQYAEAERQLASAVIRAPIDGIVSQRHARAGEQSGAEPLILIIRDSTIEFAAEVPETDLPKLAIGQLASVRLPGRADAIVGSVRMVGPKIDRETRLGNARISLDTKDPLFAGVIGKARVVFATRNSIVISDSSLVYERGSDNTAVFVVDDGRVKRRWVETGLRKDGKVEIRAGLTPGERIVAKAGATLREGDSVTVVDVTPPSVSIKQ